MHLSLYRKKAHAVPSPKSRAGRIALLVSCLGVGAAMVPVGCGGNSESRFAGLPLGKATSRQVAIGRYLVVSSGCGDCHSHGSSNPGLGNWLSGFESGDQAGAFQLGPSTTVYAPNLTPDVATGIGGFSDQAIFNALRFGFDPATPTGSTQRYLAPVMPWASFRHKSDEDLWAIVAYLKHGAGAISHEVPENTGEPPDFWAGAAAGAGSAISPAYPAGVEHFNP